jgi:acetyl-CoA carboxylase biotin carboxyl carrier protein
MFPLASSQPTTITVDLKEIRKIVELMDQHELSYFHLKEEGVDLKMKKGADIVQVAQAAMPAAPASAPAAQAAPAGGEAPADAPAGNAITAPMVGTYYSASSPDAAAFVKVGDTIHESHERNQG